MKSRLTPRHLTAAFAVIVLLASSLPASAQQNTPVFLQVGLKYEIRMVRAIEPSEVVTVVELSNQWIKVRDGQGKVFWLNTALASTIQEVK